MNQNNNNFNGMENGFNNSTPNQNNGFNNQVMQNNNFNDMGNGFNNSTPNQNNGFNNQVMQNNNFNDMGNGFNNSTPNQNNGFGSQGPASNDFQNNQQSQFNGFQNNNGVQNNGFGNMNNSNANSFNNQNNMPNNQQFNPNFQNGQIIGLKPGNNTSSSSNKKIIFIVAGVLVIIAICVLAYFVFFNTKTITCTADQSYGSIKASTKVSASFKNNKAVSASMEMIIDLNNQNTAVVDQFYETFKTQLEKQYGTDYAISKKDKTIIAEMSVKAGDTKFGKVINTNDNDTPETFIKQMEEDGYTCNNK